MYFTDYLTPKSKSAHEDRILDISTLKLNHLKTTSHIANIDWRNVCLIWYIGNKRFPTLILDRQQGLYAIPAKPSTLMKQLMNMRPLGCKRTMMAAAKHVGVNNYVPTVQGEFCMSPLKSVDGKEQSWLALHHIDDYTIGNRSDNSLVQFRDCHEKVLIPTTHRFIFNREKDWTAIMKFQQTILNTIKATFAGVKTSATEISQYQAFTSEVREFELEAVEEWTEKVLRYVGFDEQTLAPTLKELMKEFDS